MSHRPITAIEIVGFEPGGTPRAMPIFEWVDPGTLLVDEGYQRESSERSLKLVRKIVAGWNWGRFKPPVAVLTDAGLELIDGQHTAIAAATHPDIGKIPVMVVDVPERADRAGSFVSHNRDRIAVTSLQIHAASVTAGDADAIAVAGVAAAAGLTVLTRMPGAGRYKPATTVGVAAISALIRGRGVDAAIKVLTVLSRAGLAPVNGVHMRAADMLLFVDEYASQINDEQLLAAIQATALKIDSEIAVFRAAHPSTPPWKAMGIIWFRNRRASRASGSVPLGNVTTSRDDVTDPMSVSSTSNEGAKIITRASGGQKAVDGSGAYQVCANSQTVAVPKQSNRDDSCKRDSRPKLSGWIPGPVLRRCAGCDEKYTGDVKSKSCADCAYGCREAVSA